MVKIHVWLLKTGNWAEFSSGLWWVIYYFVVLSIVMFHICTFMLFPVQYSEWMRCDIIWISQKYDDFWIRVCVWDQDFSYVVIQALIWHYERSECEKAASVCEGEVNLSCSYASISKIANQFLNTQKATAGTWRGSVTNCKKFIPFFLSIKYSSTAKCNLA